MDYYLFIKFIDNAATCFVPYRLCLQYKHMSLVSRVLKMLSKFIYLSVWAYSLNRNELFVCLFLRNWKVFKMSGKRENNL